MTKPMRRALLVFLLTTAIGGTEPTRGGARIAPAGATEIRPISQYPDRR